MDEDVIDLTVDTDSEENESPYSFKLKSQSDSDDDEIIIVEERNIATVNSSAKKRSASPVKQLRKKQRLTSPKATQEDSESVNGILKVKDLFKPKGKKAIADMVLSDDVIEKRFEPLGGLRGFDIDLSLAELDMLVSRKFMSSVYGGSAQRTFPPVGKEKFAEHGMDDFMYLHMDYQPCAPQIPGRPGLWFTPSNRLGNPTSFVARVLTRDLKLAMWQYVGQYDVRPALSLTREEWLRQESKVKTTWTKQICKKTWGQRFCAQVLAHKELGRSPTTQEVEDVFTSGRWQNVTPDNVMAALNRGKVRLQVWTMVCIGYDRAFQLQLCERFPRWTGPPPTERKEKKSKPKAKKGGKEGTKSPAKGRKPAVELDDSAQENSEAEYDSDESYSG